MMIHTIYGLGDFGSNCYIIETEQKNAMMIDAPYSADIISREIDRLGLTLKKILLTHGHCDHIEALGGLVEKYGCEVYISEQDAEMLTSRRLCLAEYFNSEFAPFYGAKTLNDGDIVSLDEETLTVMSTPGHSKGSVCYIHKDSIFTGDTLFQDSIGRTDFPDGDFEELLNSIARLYRESDKNYVIYPGHGEPSDLLRELRFNPYLDVLRG